MTRASTSNGLSRFVGALANISNALQVLAVEVPGRTSIRQGLAFMVVARADAMGSSMTLTELREAVGADTNGAPLLGLSVDRIFNTFLEPTKRDPEALGWCFQETDPDDRRRKYLRLTPEGRKVAKRIVEALEG